MEGEQRKPLAKPGVFLRALCLWSVLSPIATKAQTWHELKPVREAVIVGGGGALHVFSLWKYDRNKALPVSALDRSRIPLIDRVATSQWSLSAHRSSNVLFGVATAASLATAVINQHGEQPLLPVVIIMESGLFSAGLTNTVKELVRRPRPYLYNEAVPSSAYHPGEDAVSFWSGHTANMAAVSFSCANLVQRSNASPGLKTATWIGAALAPAAMGYLRVRAGRHFPTDVLTGYVVGAAVGFVVPYFHRTSNRP